MKRTPPDHATVKLQVTGPVTLAIALERGAGRIGAGAEVVSLAHEVAVWLAANAADQVRSLADLGIDVLLVVDEPGLAHAGVSAARPVSGIRCALRRRHGACTSADACRGR